MQDKRQTLGDRVAMMRDSAGLSRERLAARAGVSSVTVYKVEHGSNATYDTLEKIAGALEVELRELIG